MGKRLTHEEFMERFYKKNENAENIEILGEYVNNRTKIKCKCKIDGYEWEVKPNDLLNNHGCPKCSGKVKKTTKEFINEIKEINSDIEILGEYVGALTKIKCKCKIDGYEWEMTPNSLLNGQGCPKCAGNIKKTTESFKQEMKKINNNIEILGEYVNNKTKIKCRCKIDGHEWEVKPNSLLSGSGCPKCAGKNKTTESFKQEMKKINGNIEILGEYVNNYTKIKVRCKIDGYEWKTTPNSLLNGCGCPKCAGNIQLTHEEFMEKFYKQNKNAENIEILGKYVNHKTKIRVCCKIDGHEWEIKANNLLNGQGCPKCAGKNKTTESFKQEMKKINGNIEILGEYKGAMVKIKCRCKLDNHIWYAKPYNLLNNHGCPKCNSSKGEKRIAKYLDSKNIKYKSQYKFNDCRSKDKLPFDFYIPSLNIAIEYDGIQHYEIVEYFGGFNIFIDTKIRDTIKTIYCKENNIKLIRIPYWDFDNIEKILEKEL